MRQCKSVVLSHLDCGALLKQPKETDPLPLLRSKLYLPIQWLSAENPSLLDFTIENKNSSLQSPIAWSPSRLSQSKKLFTPVKILVIFLQGGSRCKQINSKKWSPEALDEAGTRDLDLCPQKVTNTQGTLEPQPPLPLSWRSLEFEVPGLDPSGVTSFSETRPSTLLSCLPLPGHLYWWWGKQGNNRHPQWSCCCSVAKSCPTLCHPMDCSMPEWTLGDSILHYLPEFAQIHAHWVNSTI